MLPGHGVVGEVGRARRRGRLLVVVASAGRGRGRRVVLVAVVVGGRVLAGRGRVCVVERVSGSHDASLRARAESSSSESVVVEGGEREARRVRRRGNWTEEANLPGCAYGSWPVLAMVILLAWSVVGWTARGAELSGGRGELRWSVAVVVSLWATGSWIWDWDWDWELGACQVSQWAGELAGARKGSAEKGEARVC